MRSSICIITLGSTLLACASANYKQMYRQTNSVAGAKPVAANQVRVMRSRDDLIQSHQEIGIYQGHAPTTKEAMEAAKRQCGMVGADLFILNVQPFASEGRWKVDGICALGRGTQQK